MARRTASPELRRFIDHAAGVFQIPGWLLDHGTSREAFSPGTVVEGVCITESDCEPKAVRYERHQDVPGRVDAATDPDQPGIDDSTWEDDKSYGIMQVMGYNIRELLALPRTTTSLVGPERLVVTIRLLSDFSFAFNPEVGLALGCLVLHRELVATGGNMARALARYNGGPSGDDGSPMRRQDYVDLVAAHCRLAKAARTQESWPT